MPSAHRTSIWALVLLAVVTSFAPTAAEDERSDPLAVAAADQVMRALGGRHAWNDLRGLRWIFGSEIGDSLRGTPRRHAWDKHRGWHRVEGKNRNGQDYCIIHNLNDDQGHAWVAGEAIEGDSLQKLIDYGEATWINDSYWFLMPYKLRDPGVILEHQGLVQDGDKTWDKIALSFDNVGRTPGDRYWVYIDHATKRIEKWEYLLEGREPPPAVATWEGWEQHDGLWFPTSHRSGERNIFTRDVETVSAFRDGEFERP